MKKYLITGLVILLPLALTVAIVVFMIHLLTDPFLGIVSSILGKYEMFNNGFLFLEGTQVRRYLSQLIILFLLFFFTVGLGFVARWFLFNYLLRCWDYLIHRIPLIRTIYKTCQDVINTMFGSSSNSFKQVVMVPFPGETTYSIGLVTRENLPGLQPNNQENLKESLVAVFVPTTPNPTSGFLMMFKQSDLVYLDMKVEDAFKYVISCGVIAAPFNGISKEQAQHLATNQTEIIQKNEEKS